MKVLTLFGTRPEIIRLSVIIKRIDAFAEQVLVHTGQNYDPNLSEIFFDELGLRRPDRYLGVRAGGFAEQAAQILQRAGAIRAMELDINYEWVTFNSYASPGGIDPSKLLPAMSRPSTRYLSPDDRDFIAVFSRSSG